MKAAVWYDKKNVKIEERELKSVGENDVKVKIAWSGICATDLHEYEYGPILIPTEDAHPMTNEKAPLVLGHEFSGVVEEVGSNVSNVKVGDRVAVYPLTTTGDNEDNVDRYYEFFSMGLHTDGGFAEYAVTSSDNAVKIPDALPLDKAAVTEPFSVATQAVKDSGVSEGDVVAVFGAGPIGLFTIAAAVARGAKEIFAFDLSNERLEKAKEVGATYAVNSGEHNPVEFIKEKYPKGVDASLEVAGVKITFDQAIASTKPLGKVVVVAMHGKDFEFNPVQLMLSGVSLSSSLGYSRETFNEVLEQLIDDKVNVDPIITNKIELDDLVTEGFERLPKDLSEAKVLVKLSGEL